MPEIAGPSLARSCVRDIHAVLQAGGRGRRLSPFFAELPKPLVPVAGKPMIERLLHQIAGTGVKNVTILTGWKGELVRESVESLWLPRPDLSLRFIREERPLGNIGGLAYLSERQSTVLFAFADLVTDIDFVELVGIHQNSAADITLCSHIEEQQLRLGELDVEGTSVIAYHEKPVKRFRVCSGIAVLEPEVLGLIAPGLAMGMVDLINQAISAGLHVSHWEHGARWFDVNTPEALASAEHEMTNQSPPE